MADEAVISIMLQEMEKTGVVYPGFESLAKPNFSKGKESKKPTNAPSVFTQSPETSEKGFPSYQTSTNNLNPNYQLALDYLEQMLSRAKENMYIQDKTEGWLSGAAVWDAIKNTYNLKHSSKSVNQAISDMEYDINRLKMAAAGQISYSFNGEAVNFEEEFYIRRGVEFDTKKIRECDEKSKDMAQAETIKSVIGELKKQLVNAASGTVTERMSGSSERALMNVFQLLCANQNGAINVNAVNKILSKIEAENAGNEAFKYGTGIKLEKNEKGEYHINVTTQNGERNPIQPEHLRVLISSLNKSLNQTCANAIGIEYDDSVSNEELEKQINEKYATIKKDYEESFKAAYGKKNVKELSEQYVSNQQTADMVVETTLNIAMMATTLMGSGIVLSGVKTGTKALRLANAEKIIQGASDLTKSAEVLMKPLMTVQLAQPVKLLNTINDASFESLKSFFTKDLTGEELTDEEKQLRELALNKLKEYGLSVSESAVWMALGMACGAVGDKARLFLKQKGLEGVIKNTGKTADEIFAIYKSGHTPKELAKSIKQIEQIATCSGNSIEFTADILLTYAGTKALHGEDLTFNDLLMSLNGVLIGASMQKQNILKSEADRLKEFKKLVLLDNPNIKPDLLETKARTMLELSKIAKSTQENEPMITQNEDAGFETIKNENIPTLVKQSVSEKIIDKKTIIEEIKLKYQNRFNNEELIEVAKFVQEEPEFINNILEQKVIDYNAKEFDRHSFSDIKSLFEAYKENPQLVNDLLNQTDNVGIKSPRYNGQAILSIVQYNKEEPEFTQFLLSQKQDGVCRFNTYNFCTAMNLYKESPELTKKLLSQKMVSKTNTNYIYSTTDVKKLMPFYKENPQFVDKLVSYTIKLYSGEVIPRFLPNAILQICELKKSVSDKKDLDFIDNIIDMRGDNYGYKFLASDGIVDSYKYYKKEPEIFLELLKCTEDSVSNMFQFLQKVNDDNRKDIRKALSYFTSNQGLKTDSILNLSNILKDFPFVADILPSPKTKRNNLDCYGAYPDNFVCDLENFVKNAKNYSNNEKSIIKLLVANNVSFQDITKILKFSKGKAPQQILRVVVTSKRNYWSIKKQFEDLNAINQKAETIPYKRVVIDENYCVQYFKDLGLTESESIALSKEEYAPLLVIAVKARAIDEGITPNANIVREMAEYANNASESEMQELIALKDIANYFNEENFNLYKEINPDKGFDEFVNDLLSLVKKNYLEDNNINTLIQKYTNISIKEEDMISYPNLILDLKDITEADIVSCMKKINQLGLNTSDINQLGLLTRYKEFANIEPSPEIKNLTSYLLDNELLLKDLIPELLSSVCSKNKEIEQLKIETLKDFIENTNIHFEKLGDLFKNLSSNNIDVLKIQIDKIKSLKSYSNVNSFANLLHFDTPETFNHALKIFDYLNTTPKSNRWEISILNNIEKSQIDRKELLEILSSLIDRGVQPDEVGNVIININNYFRENSREYVEVYLKLRNIESLKSQLDTILSYYFSTDISKIRIDKRIEVYDTLSNLDDSTKQLMNSMDINLEKILDKIVESLAQKRPILEMSKPQNRNLFKNFLANNDKEIDEFITSFDFAHYGKDGLPLKYSRNDFSKNIDEILKDLPEEDANLILKHFGLIKGEEGYDGLINNIPFTNTKANQDAQAAANRVLEEIEAFTLNNEVVINDLKSKEILDGLIKGCPEFTSIIGKQQHDTHAYSVDIHTLKVLQSAMNNPIYKTLSDTDKTILKFSILFHDMGKKGGVVDTGHAALSADYAWSVLDRYPFPETVKERIIDIISNHHWFEKYNKNECTANNVAVHCRRPEDVKIYEIFSKADFENVNDNFHLGEKSGGSTNQDEFDRFMSDKMQPIKDAVNKIHQKANLVFDTLFMKNGEKFPTQNVKIDDEEVTLKVLNLSEIADGASLEEYGFAPGVTKENARFFVHMTEATRAKLETAFILMRNPARLSTWSTSLIKLDNNRTYTNRKFGFVLETPQANISEAVFNNIGSGNSKTIDIFERFLFKETSTNNKDEIDSRQFVKNYFVEKMNTLGYNISDENYAEITKYLFTKKYLTQIKDIKIDGTTVKAKDLIEALEYSREQLFQDDDIHNEIVSVNPKVKGLLAKVEKLEDCPPEFLKIAKEHNLPIILMPPSKHK